MKNSELQKRLKELRKRKGFTQEELAEKAELSLRTIQRIENGESDPRGETLRRLASALETSPEELLDWQIEEDDNVLTILNMSQLGYLAFPLIGILIPLMIWILKKEKIRHVDTVGRSILNFQISWNLALFSAYPLGLLAILIVGHATDFLFYTFSVYVGGLYVYNLLMIITNMIRYKKTNEVRYIPAIHFLK
ncbi:MAG: helix-turn-helix domain-containing protein [Balneolaceae bacterium]|nr:helix-turn-helix domain-containing protein [Balneolaceae bacterium]